MEALVGTTIITSSIRDIYSALKCSLQHNNSSLNDVLKRTDITAKLEVADSYIQEHSPTANFTQQVCLRQVQHQIGIVKDILESIHDLIICFNTQLFSFRRTPNLSVHLLSLECEISILDSRIHLMLKVS